MYDFVISIKWKKNFLSSTLFFLDIFIVIHKISFKSKILFKYYWMCFVNTEGS